MKYGALLLSALLVACASSSASTVPLKLISPTGTVHTFSVEIADDAEEQAVGLMNRASIPADGGMLFLFKSPQSLSFWMKNTLIPLDIIFFREDGSFVSSATMVPCEADPCPLTPSQMPASAALEVRAGTAKKLGVTKGWRYADPRMKR